MNKSATDTWVGTALRLAQQWKADQEAQGIVVSDQDYQQTLNAIKYELQYKDDFDERDYYEAASE